MNLNIVLWCVLLLALYAAVAVAVLASRPGRHWLALPAVALVAVAIVWAVFDAGRSAPGVGFLVAAGVGLLLLALVAGSPLVSLVLEFASRGAVPIGNHGVLAVDVQGIVPVEREILRGGMTIGYLERLAVVGSAFAGTARRRRGDRGDQGPRPVRGTGELRRPRAVHHRHHGEFDLGRRLRGAARAGAVRLRSAPGRVSASRVSAGARTPRRCCPPCL